MGFHWNPSFTIHAVADFLEKYQCPLIPHLGGRLGVAKMKLWFKSLCWVCNCQTQHDKEQYLQSIQKTISCVKMMLHGWTTRKQIITKMDIADKRVTHVDVSRSSLCLLSILTQKTRPFLFCAEGSYDVYLSIFVDRFWHHTTLF